MSDFSVSFAAERRAPATRDPASRGGSRSPIGSPFALRAARDRMVLPLARAASCVSRERTLDRAGLRAARGLEPREAGEHCEAGKGGACPAFPQHSRAGGRGLVVGAARRRLPFRRWPRRSRWPPGSGLRGSAPGGEVVGAAQQGRGRSRRPAPLRDVDAQLRRLVRLDEKLDGKPCDLPAEMMRLSACSRLFFCGAGHCAGHRPRLSAAVTGDPMSTERPDVRNPRAFLCCILHRSAADTRSAAQRRRSRCPVTRTTRRARGLAPRPPRSRPQSARYGDALWTAANPGRSSTSWSRTTSMRSRKTPFGQASRLPPRGRPHPAVGRWRAMKQEVEWGRERDAVFAPRIPRRGNAEETIDTGPLPGWNSQRRRR